MDRGREGGDHRRKLFWRSERLRDRAAARANPDAAVHLAAGARRRASSADEPAALFVPAVIEAQGRKEAAAKRRSCARRRPPAVELEIDGVIVRVASSADAATIAAVIEALKASR